MTDPKKGNEQDLQDVSGGRRGPDAAQPQGRQSSEKRSNEVTDIGAVSAGARGNAGPGNAEWDAPQRSAGKQERNDALDLGNVSGGARGNAGPGNAEWDAPQRSAGKQERSNDLDLGNVSGGARSGPSNITVSQPRNGDGDSPSRSDRTV